MPPPEVQMADRQRLVASMQHQLQRLGQAADRAAQLAGRVEQAAYAKANNVQEYHNFLNTSLKKAQASVQGQQQQPGSAVHQQQAQAVMPAPAQQQYMMQQPAQPQQQYMQQAQAVNQQVQHVQQQHYVQQPPAQYGRPQPVPQQQYMQAPAQQQYVQQHHQQAQQQYVQQQVQQQFMQQPQQPQQQYVLQQQAQPAYVQPQVAQQFAQQQLPQLQYLQQQPRQQQVVQMQPAQPAQQAQYAQQVAAPQQQYVQQQQHMPQQPQQQFLPAAQQAHAAIPPRDVTPAEFSRLPSFKDPAFGEFAAELFPNTAQPPAVKQQQQQQQQQQQGVPRFPPPATHGQPSVAESSAPARGTSPGVATSQPRPAGRAGLQHEPAALDDFLRLHAAFNAPATKAATLKDCERLLRCYEAQGKSNPALVERMQQRVHRHNMIFRLLTVDQPHLRVSITDQLLKFAKAFLRELGAFKEMRKKQMLAASAAGGPSAAAPAQGGGGAPGGFLAMLESGEADKLPSPFTAASQAPGAAPGGAALQGAAPALKPAWQLQQAAQQAGQQQRSEQSAAAAAIMGATGPPAEAARQQALARQRQLAEAQAEQQRRREAAAALPADGQQRLLAVAQQPRAPADVAAVQAGFQRLHKVLAATEQRLVGPQALTASTPPLPPEVQRLVARDRAALEEAAAAAGGGSGAAVLTVAAGDGRVPDGPTGGSDAAEGPAAKRQRSASPEVVPPAGGQQPRQQSELERQLAAECDEVATAVDGALQLHVARDSSNPGCAMVTCLPRAPHAAVTPGSTGGAGGRGVAGVAAKQEWQLLLLRVPEEYPAHPPTAVFPRTGHGGASEALVAAAERHQQLLDATRSRFGAALAAAAGECPPRLLRIGRAWLEATQHVAAAAGGASEV